MAVGIGATGTVGIAFEAVANTYVAPTKFFPITGESLAHTQATKWRRPTLGHADVHGAVPGNMHVAGDLTFECTEDVLPYFLYSGRYTVVKTGAGPDFTYTATPNARATATAARTLSVTVVRNAVPFGFVGCVAGRFEFTLDEGTLMCTVGLIGADEASQAAPTAVFNAAVRPFGAGEYVIEIPDNTPVSDTDTFTLTIEEGLEPAHRLRQSRAALFQKFGERAATLHLERDFETRTDYDAYKTLTSQSVSILATRGANNSIEFLAPAAIKSAYPISGLGAQGDLIRAAIDYNLVYDASTARSHQIIVKTQESIA